MADTQPNETACPVCGATGATVWDPKAKRLYLDSCKERGHVECGYRISEEDRRLTEKMLEEGRADRARRALTDPFFGNPRS